MGGRGSATEKEKLFPKEFPSTKVKSSMPSEHSGTDDTTNKQPGESKRGHRSTSARSRTRAAGRHRCAVPSCAARPARTCSGAPLPSRLPPHRRPSTRRSAAGRGRCDWRVSGARARVYHYSIGAAEHARIGAGKRCEKLKVNRVGR